jgi:hypothetical protein
MTPLGGPQPLRPSYGGGYGARSRGDTVIHQENKNYFTISLDQAKDVVEAVEFVESLPKERSLMRKP